MLKFTTRLIILVILLLILHSCSSPIENDTTNKYITESVESDFSSIENSYERWKAYNLSDYYVEQSWSCFCLPPLGCDAYIIKNEIVEVEYEIEKDFIVGRTEAEIYEQTKRMAITIDVAFEIIEEYKDKAEIFEVEYDKKYGFPTRIYIDEYLMISDDERTITFSNLKKIVN